MPNLIKLKKLSQNVEAVLKNLSMFAILCGIKSDIHV